VPVVQLKVLLFDTSYIHVTVGDFYNYFVVHHYSAYTLLYVGGYRFGLPVNFQPILVVPYRKTERQLRSVLHRLFNHLDTTADPSGIDVSSTIRL